MKEFGVKVEKTLRYHTKNALRRYREFSWDRHKPIADNPVFVVGCSRAGTTLVYKTLSESSELTSLQRETHDFWAGLHPIAENNFSTHGLTSEDASDRDREVVSRYFYAHTGSLQFVDKNNQNGLCVAYLHRLFPNARFVYVKRSPGDNIHSLIQGWGKADEFATWSSELPARVAVEGGQYRRWCFFICEGWRDYLESSIEEVCAFQYRSMNELILAEKAQVPATQWVDIQYEDLVRDPVEGFRSVFQQLGLEFTSGLQQHCAQVLSTPYNAFSEIKLDKWRQTSNASRIERVLDSVSSVASRMGYEF